MQGNTLYAKLQRAVTRFGVEPRGIERVPEDERTDTTLAKVGTVVCLLPLEIPNRCPIQPVDPC